MKSGQSLKKTGISAGGGLQQAGFKTLVMEKRAAEVDRVIEAAGGDGTFDLAWQLARPSGIVCLVAMYEEDQQLPLPPDVWKNLTFKTERPYGPL